MVAAIGAEAVPLVRPLARDVRKPSAVAAVSLVRLPPWLVDPTRLALHPGEKTTKSFLDSSPFQTRRLTLSPYPPTLIRPRVLWWLVHAPV